MWNKSTFTSLILFILLSSLDQVAAYGYYGTSWYIYLIVIFVVIAISSCIGACIRHKRNQLYIEQRQRMNATVTTATAAQAGVNPGYIISEGANYGYPGYNNASNPIGAPSTTPYGFTQPPAYEDAKSSTKDPNMPPAYEEAINAPSVPVPDSTNRTQQMSYLAQPAPYPVQAAPYSTQPAPYPTQPAPYPTQPAPYSYSAQPSTADNNTS